MTVPKTLICNVCGCSVRPKEFRSMAFPLSKPFWRAVCENCGWFGGVAETADAAMTRVETHLNEGRTMKTAVDTDVLPWFVKKEERAAAKAAAGVKA